MRLLEPEGSGRLVERVRPGADAPLEVLVAEGLGDQATGIICDVVATPHAAFLHAPVRLAPISERGLVAPAFVDAAIDVAATLDEVPDDWVGEVWDQLMNDPIEMFVDADGALGFGAAPEPPPATRAEAIDLSPSWLDTPEDMALAADDAPFAARKSATWHLPTPWNMLYRTVG